MTGALPPALSSARRIIGPDAAAIADAPTALMNVRRDDTLPCACVMALAPEKGCLALARSRGTRTGAGILTRTRRKRQYPAIPAREARFSRRVAANRGSTASLGLVQLDVSLPLLLGQQRRDLLDVLDQRPLRRLDRARADVLCRREEHVLDLLVLLPAGCLPLSERLANARPIFLGQDEVGAEAKLARPLDLLRRDPVQFDELAPRADLLPHLPILLLLRRKPVLCA